jgi:hypothetical protein
MLCAVILDMAEEKVVNIFAPIVDADRFAVVNSPVKCISFEYIATHERASKNELSKELI